MLDDLERTPEDARPARSRSCAPLAGLAGPRAPRRTLSCWPSTRPARRSPSPCSRTSGVPRQTATRKEIKLLARAGLAQPVRSDRLTIELHDLITAWLHHEYGRPGDARHQPVHQRLAGLCCSPTAARQAHGDRAEWLAYHLVSAGAWDRLTALPTLRWRSAFLVATGSDAEFLAGLDHYGHAALARAPNSLYHAVRAWLFAAHVKALIGELPDRLLAAMALVGIPSLRSHRPASIRRPGRPSRRCWLRSPTDLDVRLLTEPPWPWPGHPRRRERGQALAAHRRDGWPPPPRPTRH